MESILEGLRNYLAECPLLAEITPKNRHIDWTDSGNNNYGIFFDKNTPVGDPYINGTQEMEYAVQINVRKLSCDDVKRLENNAFLERLQRWFMAQTACRNLPELPENCIPNSIDAVNAGLLETSSSGDKGVYMIQVILNYTLEVR